MKEQIERLKQEIAKLEAQLDKFEVGKWYYINDMIVNVENFKHWGNHGLIGFGFNKDNEWSEKGTAWGVYKGDKIRPLTHDEIEFHLVQEAKRRGYDNATEITPLYLDGKPYHGNHKLLSHKFECNIKGEGDSLSVRITNSDWLRIYANGKWAEIIDEPVKFFEWEVTDKGKDYKIGCTDLSKAYLDEIYELLGYLSKDTTVKEIRKELEKIGCINDLPF